MQLDRNALYELYDACNMNSFPTRKAAGTSYEFADRYFLDEAGVYVDEIEVVGIDIECYGF